MKTLSNSPPDLGRQHAVTRGRWLEYFPIGYNTLEGLIAILAGLSAGSISLIRFGADSLIEVTSGAALLWRLRADVNESRRERVEALTLRIVGVCFLTLVVYVLYDSVTALLHREPPDPSLIGIILAAVSLIVTPLLVRAKRQVAVQLNSGAVKADAKQTELCTYLSAILLGDRSHSRRKTILHFVDAAFEACSPLGPRVLFSEGALREANRGLYVSRIQKHRYNVGGGQVGMRWRLPASYLRGLLSRNPRCPSCTKLCASLVD